MAGGGEVEGWELAAVPADRAATPAELDALGAAVVWTPAQVPGTAASSLRRAGQWSLDHPARDFDAEDWWWRVRLPPPVPGGGPARALRLEGVATLWELWADGERLAAGDNMFVGRTVTIGAARMVHLRCRALGKALEAKRPRPRYRPRIVSHAQLRFVRTSLLGRIPTWSPPAAPVGPWRPVVLVEDPAAVRAEHLTARLDGDVGVVEATLASAFTSARLRVGEVEAPFVNGRATVRVPDAPRWWPHTHGAPALLPVTAIVDGVEQPLGRAGFRTLTVDRGDDERGFGLRVNGVPVFCRGGVWTPPDVVALDATEAALRAQLGALRDAGMNMVRLSGTMVYECDAFYRLCDELGLLVWQDFMFANLDYPVEDAAFARSATAEADALLGRLSLTPSLAVLCGNSEVEQQVAMLGLGLPKNPLFAELLPARCAALRPDVPYIPSSPYSASDALPFAADESVTHYFGVGAYLRPLEDARRADVRFAAECLAFANVPSARTVEALAGAGGAPHAPRWKARVPRDAGTGWDFDDVRDHYLGRLFGVDPVRLRTVEPTRYLALGRVVTGEVMAATFAEWRRVGSRCQGGLIWFLRDLWPGAGWGVFEADGTPKAAAWLLRRALQPVALLHTDEGVNGVALHARNDGPTPLAATVEVALYRDRLRLEAATVDVTVPAHGGVKLSAERILGRFHDTAAAYHFGPSGFEVLVGTLRAAGGAGGGAAGAVLGQTFYRPAGPPADRRDDVGLTAVATLAPDGDRFQLTVTAARFAYAVALDLDDAAATVEDDYFHLAPGQARTIQVRLSKPGAPSGVVQALNASTPTRIEVPRG